MGKLVQLLLNIFRRKEGLHSNEPKNLGNSMEVPHSKHWKECKIQKLTERDYYGDIAMLIIDPQVDFHPGGSLAVANANEDSKKIADFIRKHMDSISQINITLDSHQRFHIAHSIFWQNSEGKHPAPFTLITASQIQNKEWIPVRQEFSEYALEYAQALERDGRFTLCIWPEHCIMGTKGHNIVDDVHNAALEWAAKKKRAINYVLKGSNCFTEHYSALRADVEIPSDPATSLNTSLIKQLEKAKTVIICGEALSHCVNFTASDLVANWKHDKSRLVVLQDAASSVGGFEQSGESFLVAMKQQGVTVCNAADFKLLHDDEKQQCAGLLPPSSGSKAVVPPPSPVYVNNA